MNRTLRSCLESVMIHGALFLALWAGMRTKPQQTYPVSVGPVSVVAQTKAVKNSGNPSQTRAAALPATQTDSVASAEVSAKARPEDAPVGNNPVSAPHDSAGGGGTLSGEGNSSELASIRSRIEESLHYPISLRRRGMAGKVELALSIAPTGKLKSVSVTQGSGHPELDDLAIEAAKLAAPYSLRNSEPLELRVPIEFSLSSK